MIQTNYPLRPLASGMKFGQSCLLARRLLEGSIAFVHLAICVDM
jgi:hypothetical protein